MIRWDFAPKSVHLSWRERDGPIVKSRSIFWYCREVQIEFRMVAGGRARATGLNAGAQIRRDHAGLGIRNRQIVTAVAARASSPAPCLATSVVGADAVVGGAVLGRPLPFHSANPGGPRPGLTWVVTVEARSAAV
jgi:hypothetical protein